ncbi:hypothetical protein DMTZ50_1438 [Dehalococcoides mccartyi]|nr:hypothetical protein [Dehalococcoides mccartyi]
MTDEYAGLYTTSGGRFIYHWQYPHGFKVIWNNRDAILGIRCLPVMVNKENVYD